MGTGLWGVPHANIVQYIDSWIEKGAVLLPSSRPARGCAVRHGVHGHLQGSPLGACVLHMRSSNLGLCPILSQCPPVTRTFFVYTAYQRCWYGAIQWPGAYLWPGASRAAGHGTMAVAAKQMHAFHCGRHEGAPRAVHRRNQRVPAHIGSSVASPFFLPPL